MRPLINTFAPGEEHDIIIKENETYTDSMTLYQSDGVTPFDLTGATIVGGIKERYDAPTFLKQFTVAASPPTSGGGIAWSMDLGINTVPRNLVQVPYDIVVTLAQAPFVGKRVRARAGFATISRGTTP